MGNDGVAPARVLVAGTINTDLVARVRAAPEAGETVTGSDFAIFGGGKGANQAVAAARSGAPTFMLGALGEDDFGRQRRADLRAEEIDDAHVGRAVNTPSGVALIIVDDGGQNRIAYVPGATLTVTPEQAVAAVEAIRPGVLLATLELPPSTLRALIEAARAIGATIVLNATPEPLSGRALLPLVDVLIVNETEATDLLGRSATDGDWASAGVALRDLGPGSVVITLGGAGAAVVPRDEAPALRPAPAVAVVDTTGAGDAYAAGFLAALTQGKPLAQAGRWGSIAAAEVIGHFGARPQADLKGLVA